MPQHPLRALACALSAALVSAALALPAVTPAAAAIAAGWSILPSPNAGTSSTANLLDAVSCPVPGICMAVGSYSSGDRTKNLAEHWNGTRWSLLPIPDPAGDGDFLSGLSCPGNTSCTAVGGGETASGGGSTRPLAEHWNGHTWSIQPTPAGPGALSSLDSVSCVSEAFCVAVGTAGPQGDQALIEAWNGHAWSVVPAHTGHAVATLLSVSCVSTADCVAVGSWGSSVKKTLAERWDGTAWSVEPSPNAGPSGTSNALVGVYCVNASRCRAIGGELTGPGTLYALGEVWNGGKWSIVKTPATPEDPYAVSCQAISSCVATGADATGQSLIMHWNGQAWSVVASPHHPGTQSELDDVSCRAAGCIAVGNYYASNDVNRTLTESSYPGASTPAS